jgi:hypothetical protein
VVVFEISSRTEHCGMEALSMVNMFLNKHFMFCGYNNIHYDNCMYIASYYFIDKSNVYKNKIAMFVNLSGGVYQDSPYGDLYFFVKDGVIVHTCRPPEIGTSRPEMVFNDVLIHTGFIDDTEVKEEEVVKSSANYSVSGNV